MVLARIVGIALLAAAGAAVATPGKQGTPAEAPAVGTVEYQFTVGMRPFRYALTVLPDGAATLVEQRIDRPPERREARIALTDAERDAFRLLVDALASFPTGTTREFSWPEGTVVMDAGGHRLTVWREGGTVELRWPTGAELPPEVQALDAALSDLFRRLRGLLA